MTLTQFDEDDFETKDKVKDIYNCETRKQF